MNKINLSIGVIILLILLLTPSIIFSQDYELMIKDGIKEYKSSQYNLKKTYKTAYDLLILPAEQGDKIAQLYIGHIYSDTYKKNNDFIDYRKALEWYTLSANQGCDTAEYYIGYLYYKGGPGIKYNYTEAFKWFLKAANKGNNWAQKEIAKMYENGQGVQKDYEKALDWYKKSAEQGDYQSLYKVGKMYENGIGVGVNISEAIKFYTKSHSNGANDRLFEIYYNGLHDVEIDYKKAYSHATDALMRGIMLQVGLGVDRDTVRAVELIKSRFDPPHEYWTYPTEEEYNKSKVAYGRLYQEYLEKLKIAQNKKLEIDEVEFKKGLEYYNSNNYEKAFDIFIGLSEYDYPRVHYFIGYMYLTGKGVEQNSKEGLIWIEKSVYGGDAYGQAALGMFYLEGLIVKKDIDKAKELLKKASDQGHEGAIEELRKLQ